MALVVKGYFRGTTTEQLTRSNPIQFSLRNLGLTGSLFVGVNVAAAKDHKQKISTTESQVVAPLVAAGFMPLELRGSLRDGLNDALWGYGRNDPGDFEIRRIE